MTLRKEQFFYFFLYACAFLLVLTTQGVFWDDWVVFHVPDSARLNLYTMSGRPLYGHFFNFLYGIDFDGFTIFRALIFTSFFAVILIFDQIVKRITELSYFERFSLVVLFAMFPVNSSRIAVTMAQYTVCNLLFFIGFFLVLKSLETKKLYLRAIAFVLFFLSFNMDSLLVFFSTLLMYVYYQECKSNDDLSKIQVLKKSALKYIDLLLVPIIYFVIKQVFFQPYGLYQNYNKVSLGSATDAALGTLRNTVSALYPVFYECYLVLIEYPLVIGIVAIVVFAIISKFFTEFKFEKTSKPVWKLFFLGVLFLILGTYPYYVVNAYPHPYNWSSRHQILMPLGGAFIVFYGLMIFVFGLERLVNKFTPAAKATKLDKKAKLAKEQKDSENRETYWRWTRNLSLSLVVALFGVTNFVASLQYQKDWYKQMSILEHLKVNDTIRNNTSFRFLDKTYPLNATYRTYNFYEYTGLMKYAYGDETRYGSPDMKFDEAVMGAVEHPQYNISQFKFQRYQYNVFIDYGRFTLTDESTLELTWDRFFNPEAFAEKIKNIVTLVAVKI